ncbi:MAG: efflux RND transporter periplasmic adaptor subunit [Planctomycetota bacterium]|jgi:HlyD family secretion protein
MLKRIVIALVLVAVAAGMWWMAQGKPVAVDVGEVTRGTVRSFVEEEGMTRVVDRFIVAAPVAGRLLRLDLEEGDAVKRGDPVAEIDPLQLKSRVQETEAQVRSMKSRIDGVERKKPKPEELERASVLEAQAKRQLDVATREIEEAAAEREKSEKIAARVRTLLKRNSATQSELDAASAAETQARAREKAAELRLEIRGMQVKAAELNTAVLRSRLQDFEWEEADYREQITGLEARLKALRDDLERTRILVPTDGIVLNIYQESERVVAAGTPILDIGDLGNLEVEADFLSEDVAHMKIGMPAEIFGRAMGDAVLAAEIKRIYPSAFEKISSLGVEQQRVKVVVEFDETEATLGDRFRVEVRVVFDQRDNALLVPEGALFRHGGGWHVFKLGGNSAHLVPLKTGLRDGRVREVLEGLEEGDRVVLHPDAALEDGVEVEPLPGS